MHDGYGSFRSSLVFRIRELNNGRFGCGMNLSFTSPRASFVYKMTQESSFPDIRWKKGELIGSGVLPVELIGYCRRQAYTEQVTTITLVTFPSLLRKS